jgi:signal peptidase I
MKKKALLIFSIFVTGTMAAGAGLALGSRPTDITNLQRDVAGNVIKFREVGSAMSPVINNGDWLIATTKFSNLSAGDTVVFKYPKDLNLIYVRRIVGVPGDRVVTRYYSNVKITTIYDDAHPRGVQIPSAAPNGNAYGQYESTVTPNAFYVEGDNVVPGSSSDSDEWGLLPRADILGIVTARTDPSPRHF